MVNLVSGYQMAANNHFIANFSKGCTYCWR